MVQIKSLSVLALAAGALADTIAVDVGSNGDVFTPSTIAAKVGDVIQFNFNGRHSVVQSEFDSPCSSSSTTGINSGTMSSGAFSVLVNSTDPIWLFCGFARHCQSGMTAVINPPSSGDTLDAYTQASGSTSSSKSPSDVQGGIVGDASSFASAGSGSASSSASGSSATSAAASSGSSGSSATAAASSASGSPSSSTTSSSSSTTSSSAAEKVKAFGVAGVAGLFAAILA